MSLDSKTEYRQEYLYVKTKGSFDFQDAETIIINALNSVYEQGLYGVLFDIREVTGNLFTMQRYELAKTVAGLVSDFLQKRKLFWYT